MRNGIVSVIAAAALCYCSTAKACVLRMAAEVNFPPYLMLDGQRWHGQTVELAQLLVTEVGCHLEVVNVPWLRALAQIKSGELDFVSHLSYSKARIKDFAFIGPHHIESMWLIGNPAKLPKVTALKDLSETVDLGRIAELVGAYYGEEFALLKQNPFFARQLVSISSIQDKLALLEAGRVNAILEDDSVLRYWQTEGYKNAQNYQPLMLVYKSPVYFGFSKKTLSDTMLVKLKNAWQTIYDRGDVDKTIKKYQGKSMDGLTPTAKF
ncbi:ABC transporter substrate-binding protein [Rheinheimera sp.]|uniref:substrate-binding periplasmic protein n=1 Tax=Rheinheimera sp. TaxID=1869214 RepID=UPI002633A234|nr:transporter substrate-binding domain-containing protein [Rheinheimera sp.]MCA1928661.1 transporter substrate-binding domain-containing protein [Rheinheimera sp.]